MTAPLLELTWTDPETGTRGYVVIDRLIRGLASGGFRIREGLTLDEVAGLARGMTRKEALVYDPADRYVPFGGAKGGLDIDPASPLVDGVLTRLFTAIGPVLREQWATGEDLGVRQETLDAAARRAGLASTVESLFSRIDDPDDARRRLADAFRVEVAGVALADLVGGYGVAQAVLAYAGRQGREPAQLTAAVQGFGSIGGAAARYLARAGVRVIGVADRNGLLVDEDGHDVEALLRARDGSGAIDRDLVPERVVRAPGDRWLELDVDVLVPAAVSYAVHVDDTSRIQATLIVEGANMPVLPDAEDALAARGIPVVPDFLANVGTNAWWWWVVFGDVATTADAAFARLSATMRRLLDDVADAAERDGVSLRTAALAIADRNAATLEGRNLDAAVWQR